MAGSEQDGLDGRGRRPVRRARPGCSRRPAGTDADAYAGCAAWSRELGAEVVAVTPEHHDALVAVVSHVPQLAASTLMDVAATDAARSTRACCGSRPAASAT